VGDSPSSSPASSPLPTRRLGLTDMHLSRVGLGTWAMGGLGPKMTWGDADDTASVATILRAVELGVNWVDTAAFYGWGHSEEVLGAAAAQLPEADRPFMSTKCGLRWGLAERTLRIGTPASIRWELDESLMRLGVERIDLYFVHWPPEDATPIEEYWGELVDLRRRGKIRAAGLSNHNLEQLKAAEAVGHVDVLQPPFSAIDRKAAQDLLPWCLANNVAVVNYAAMQNGLLTGTFSERRVKELADNDWRKTHANFTGDDLARNVALADAMRPIADKHATTVGAVAVAWTLAVPGVTAAIVGARQPAQVGSLVAAAGLELDYGDLAAIATAIEATGAGQGPFLAPPPPGAAAPYEAAGMSREKN
jgi:aryl-alcohol dehydrogenase-like predicted oxidoreductase